MTQLESRATPCRSSKENRRGGTAETVDACGPRLCALRGVPSRGGESEPDDPDRPAGRAQLGASGLNSADSDLLCAPAGGFVLAVALVAGVADAEAVDARFGRKVLGQQVAAV